VACEPRHASWFAPAADDLLSRHRIARVAADPARVPAAWSPAGWPGLAYFRLHGSPRIYYSDYEPSRLTAVAEALACDRPPGAARWCIFDNTTLGFATGNALALARLVGSTSGSRSPGGSVDSHRGG
jgi:uncharacterized protein YecE (DUF72 family)